MSETTEIMELKQSLLEGTSVKDDVTDKLSTAVRDIDIKEFHLGVWHIKVALPKGRFAVKHYVDTIRSSIPLVRRLTMDIWALSPSLFILYLFCQFWNGVEEALLMQLTGTLLRKVWKRALDSYIY